ncbi:MAG: DUF5662 family protein [Agathobacter sp.]|nr:DUF5662 family protein [Agathobacter sp.]
MKAWNHFKTITHHKILVLVGCFKIGLYKQGLLHDLSKYTPTEFLVGCKYYQGYMSPNNAERMDKGYSSAWLHHKGRNKHHLEYWIDYSIAKEDDNNGAKNGMTGMKMPIKYVCEMFIDRISASKNYQKEKYTDRSSLEYYEKSKDHYIINEDTAALLEYLLEMLVARGEKETFSFIKNELLKGKVPYEKEELIRRKEALHIPG